MPAIRLVLVTFHCDDAARCILFPIRSGFCYAPLFEPRCEDHLFGTQVNGVFLAIHLLYGDDPAFYSSTARLRRTELLVTASRGSGRVWHPALPWGAGGGLAAPQLEERFAHGLLLWRRETGLKDVPALVPGLGKLAEEFPVVFYFVQGQAQEGQADGGEDIILVPVRLVPPFVRVAAVVELDGEHGHPVFIPADEEIDVLLADLVAVADGSGDRQDDVGQIDLGEELAAALGELVE